MAPLSLTTPNAVRRKAAAYLQDTEHFFPFFLHRFKRAQQSNSLAVAYEVGGEAMLELVYHSVRPVLYGPCA